MNTLKALLLNQPEPPAPEPSDIADIVGRCRVPSGLRLALQNWRQLQSDYDAASRKLQGLIHGNVTSSDATGRIARESAIREAQEALSGLSELVRPALAKVRLARPSFIAVVKAALEPVQTAAAASALAALDELDAQFAVLDAVADELQRCGCDDLPVSLRGMSRQTLGTLRNRLRRLQ